jgi:hypothetical protein
MATPTLALTHPPTSDGSVHVYLNGVEQFEATDWLLVGSEVRVQAAMGAQSGDLLEARYVYEVGP